MVRHNKRIVAFSVVTVLLLISFFSAGISVVAKDVEDGKELSKSEDFPVSNAKPIQWGALIPRPNTESAIELTSGYYQTQVTLYDWDMDQQDQDGVTQGDGYGDDNIDWAYPWMWTDQEASQSETIIRSLTNNDYINPWNTRWIKVNANGSIAKADTVDGDIEITLTRDWFCMDESERLCFDYQTEVPVQIDIAISKSGPKILRYDLLSEVGMNGWDNFRLIDPNGHQ
jgi:hypothetical protein